MERRYSISISSKNRTIVSTEHYPVYQNDITFLFGESGIGKSLLSKALYGLLDPDGLDIAINGEHYGHHLQDEWTKAIRSNSFFVFQEPSSHLNPLLTIKKQLNEGSLQGHDDHNILNYLWQTTEDDAVKKIINVFPKPYRPSGGEKQRILLAMAFKRINALINSSLLEEPSFFVFDEPTGSLDNNYRNIFLELLFSKYAACPFTIQIITHDYSIISEVYKNHRHLLKNIHFKELSPIDEGAVAINDFSSTEYLKWLDAPRVEHTAKFSKDTVLSFDSNFTIFGHNHSIFENEARTRRTSLIINKGDMVYLKAPSGIGKTTLAKIIMGIYHPQQFSMKLAGLPITQRTRHSIWPRKIWGNLAGMVFQHADESLNLQATVKETFDGLPGEAAHLKVSELKENLQEFFEGTISNEFLRKKVVHLSGGQKQRLNLLRTLVPAPDLIILDEPLNGLDFKSVKKVLEMLDEKRASGSALLMISHNEEIFEHFISEEFIYYLS